VREVRSVLALSEDPGGWSVPILRTEAARGEGVAELAQKIDELWWWSWAFALLEVGTATAFAINAMFGVPEGADAWPFWVLAAVNGAFGAGLLVGMGIGGQEKPFV